MPTPEFILDLIEVEDGVGLYISPGGEGPGGGDGPPGSPGLVWRGIWSNIISYDTFDVTSYDDGLGVSSYVSLITANLNHNPTSTLGVDWALLAQRGTDTTFVHTQNTASMVWYVYHNMHKYPSVMTTDSARTVFDAEVHYVDIDNLTITLTQPLTGFVYCT